ncbi:hypothetical protein [Paenibacillus illinoisensis]|nr:hypothetical protein [Paenibacillus illinoisensis]
MTFVNFIATWESLLALFAEMQRFSGGARPRILGFAVRPVLNLADI